MMKKIQWIEAPAQEQEPVQILPIEQGYFFPAEWEKHEATWLSWPHNIETWPGKFESIWPAYLAFIQIISLSEKVNINVNDYEMARFAFAKISSFGAEMENIYFYENPTNDAWIRDHGPSFLVHKSSSNSKLIVDWEYNAWGGKYPPFHLDNSIPRRIGAQLGLNFVQPNMVLEGGSFEVNGNGLLITSESCLLNKNRNPGLSKIEIEHCLIKYLGVSKIIWVKEGIVGDDTDGHIDDTVRFVNADTVIAMVEGENSDENHKPLKVNLDSLQESNLNVIQLQMPEPIWYNNQRLPASYANYYLTNEHVVVPIFNSKNDEGACSILQDCFPTRKVMGIDARELIWGLGAFHCLSQQQPF